MEPKVGQVWVVSAGDGDPHSFVFLVLRDVGRGRLKVLALNDNYVSRACETSIVMASWFDPEVTDAFVV